MFTDPVFTALSDYKNDTKGDVIRFELIIRAEIARIDQYIKYAYLPFHKKALIEIKQERIDNLRQTLDLIPAYLDLQFRQHLKSISFWERLSLKAQAPNWKYTYYAKERTAGIEELRERLEAVAKVSIKTVKQMQQKNQNDRITYNNTRGEKT